LQEFFDLSTAAQEQLLDRLTNHALCKMRRLTWRGARIARGGSIPGGYEPYDLALEAITDALDGQDRNWNRQKYTTVEQFLVSIVDSKISNLVNLAENKSERRLAPPSGKDDTVTAYEIPGTERDPLLIVIDREWQTRFHEAAMKELEGDEFLVQLLECMEAEIIKPLEIAEALSTKEKPITADDVNNATKRLERKLKKLDTGIKPTKKGKL
jgi:hypothetical protein